MRDEVVPGSRWEFDESVTAAFDDMLARSIPDYLTMRNLVVTLGSPFVTSGSVVLDLGCSRGVALATVRAAATHAEDVAYIGLDVSEPMVDAARVRFTHASDVQILQHDLRQGLAWFLGFKASLVLSVLTLQFVAVEHRARLVAEVFDGLQPGGAFLLVEKVLGSDAVAQQILVDRYHAMKRANGYTAEAVEAKRASLEGVLVPLTAAGNEALLRGAGFRTVECVWRWCNFAAWLAVR